MRSAAVSALVGVMVLLGTARFVPAEPVELLPVGHALYEDLDALAARGVFRSIAVYTRPIARIDLARALIDAREREPSLQSDLHFRRLTRELVRELGDLDTPVEKDETGPLLDVGSKEQRFRLSVAGHLRGDFDEKREAAHWRLRDESSLAARMGLQLGSGFGAYEELGVTRIRGQREFIDAIALHTDLEAAVIRGELTARVNRLSAVLGYDAQRWGPGRRGTLLLSGASGPMSFFSLGGSVAGDAVSVSGIALTGIISLADHQYLAAHRLELSIGPRLVIGLAEGARYQGSLDILYASGLLPYTIIERIRIREASNDSLRTLERANVMASADVSYRAWPGLTLYGELLVDDFATESADMPNRIGYQLGLRSERPYGAHYVHLLGEYTRVRDFTYSVEYGEDFIYRGRPLGFALGPDVENVYLESAFDVNRAWQLRWSGDFTNHGEGRLGTPWFTAQGPASTVGLRGIVEERREVWGDVRWLPRDNVDLSAGFGFRRLRNENNVLGADREAWLARFAADARY